jgi:hypothetical protein
MKVEYAKRAVADLYKASADSRAFGEMVAAAVEVRIREIIGYIREHIAMCAIRCMLQSLPSFLVGRCYSLTGVSSATAR